MIHCSILLSVDRSGIISAVLIFVIYLSVIIYSLLTAYIIRMRIIVCPACCSIIMIIHNRVCLTFWTVDCINSITDIFGVMYCTAIIGTVSSLSYICRWISCNTWLPLTVKVTRILFLIYTSDIISVLSDNSIPRNRRSVLMWRAVIYTCTCFISICTS